MAKRGGELAQRGRVVWFHTPIGLRTACDRAGRCLSYRPHLLLPLSIPSSHSIIELQVMMVCCSVSHGQDSLASHVAQQQLWQIVLNICCTFSG